LYTDILTISQVKNYHYLIESRDQNVDCEVLLPGRGIFADLLHEKGIPVRIIEINPLSRRTFIPYIKTVFEIRRIIRKNNFSIIHCAGAYPTQHCLPAARLCKIPCIVHINTTVYKKCELVKNFVPYADLIIGVSEGVKRQLHRCINVPDYKIVSIYDGVSRDEKMDKIAKSSQLKKDLNLDNEKVVGQVATVIPRKGYELFIQMAAIVKKHYSNVKFLIIGKLFNDEYEKSLRSLVDKLNLNNHVIFTGFQKDFHSFYIRDESPSR